MIFLTATKDLQNGRAYEQALTLLEERYGEQSITVDRGLFESGKDWRKRYKQVYGQAEAVYILAREDGTVGLGIWKQWKYLQKQGVPMALMFASSGGGSVDVTEYEQFSLKRISKDGAGEENLARFAVAELPSST